MVFIVLNIIAALSFIFLTYYVDKKLQIDARESSNLLVPMMIVVVETVLLILVMLLRDIWIEALTGQIMRIVFCLDGIFFVYFSFCLVGLAASMKRWYLRILKLALCASVIYVVYAHFNSVDIGADYSIYIGSEYLFSGKAVQYFPWTWVSLYNAVYKFFLPSFCFVFLTLLQEKNGNQLQRYQALVIGEGIILMWILTEFFQLLGRANASFTSLFVFAYLFMYIVVIMAVSKTSIPSGKGMFATFLRVLVGYIIPGIVVGVTVMFLQPVNKLYTPGFLVPFIFVSAISVVLSIHLSEMLAKSSKMVTADYGPALEKDLASIDYSGEMDEVTNRMNGIFRRNVEASSMNVYVLNNKGTLETAYSSNDMHTTIAVNNPIFDTLLNINKSVIIFSEVGNEHDLAPIEKELTEFFETTKSDAFFILNEGHNILGLITLGKKISGDHYKEYDYNVFEKLYSYFFVFGYYMRNISNKDIISVVNREIRMSSQIITSIQENIDHVKNPKVDTGYLMVPSHNIGGEFIDMIRLTDTRHLFVVGDMSGRGIAASMNMVILKSIIRTYLAETHDFKELVIKVNSFVRDSLRKGTVFAGLFALIDFETDTMYYINCGIPALMLYTQVYNNVIEIQGSGHVLGFVKDLTPFVSVKTTKLNKGDIILACTDGLVQSHSLRGEQFGKERIQQCILDNSTYNAQRMTQFTFDTLKKFMSKEIEDDVSILVLKYGSVEPQTVEEDDTEVAEVIETAPVVDEDLPEGAALDIPEVDEVTVVESAAEETVVPEETAPVAEDFAIPDSDEALIAAAVAEAEAAALAENSVEEEVVEPAAEITVTEETVPEAPVEETEVPAAVENDFAIDDPDIPDLSNLDEMLKMAGL